MYSMVDIENPEDIWARQYPYGGFCFGPDKPKIDLIQEKGKQVVRFGGSAVNGEIRGSVYPDFSLKHWWRFIHDEMGEEWLRRLGIEEEKIEREPVHGNLLNMLIDARAPGEKDFIELFEYLNPFGWTLYESGNWREVKWEAPDWIPALIPQVWIQWHSDTIEELRKWDSPYTSQPQRIDFAMFWKNKRHAILIDGIQHYANREGSRWFASEEQYSKRLIEDRFLRMNDWRVFRISNWELRDWREDITRALKVMHDLEEFVGFNFDTDWTAPGMPGQPGPPPKPIPPPRINDEPPF
jgi:hypothetical protein